MSDTPETDRIARLLENLDEWIDDSLRKSKPIGLTLCAARSTIADHRARITEMWDALETLRRERDEAIRQLENLKAVSIHTCHDQCQRPMCVLRRERDEAREALRELWQTADAYIPQIDEEQTTKWHNAMALHTTLQKVK
jgi:NifB/MoaA-like Fe-S oxidoreductase